MYHFVNLTYLLGSIRRLLIRDGVARQCVYKVWVREVFFKGDVWVRERQVSSFHAGEH